MLAIFKRIKTVSKQSVIEEPTKRKKGLEKAFLAWL